MRPAVGREEAPHRAPRIKRIATHECARRAQHRACAVRGDDEVVRTIFGAGTIDEAVAVVTDLPDAYAGADRDGVHAGRVQQREQRAARHAKAEALRCVIGVAHVHDHAVRGVHAVQPLDA